MEYGNHTLESSLCPASNRILNIYANKNVQLHVHVLQLEVAVTLAVYLSPLNNIKAFKTQQYGQEDAWYSFRLSVKIGWFFLNFKQKKSMLISAIVLWIFI